MPLNCRPRLYPPDARSTDSQPSTRPMYRTHVIFPFSLPHLCSLRDFSALFLSPAISHLFITMLRPPPLHDIIELDNARMGWSTKNPSAECTHTAHIQCLFKAVSSLYREGWRSLLQRTDKCRCHPQFGFADTVVSRMRFTPFHVNCVRDTCDQRYSFCQLPCHTTTK